METVAEALPSSENPASTSPSSRSLADVFDNDALWNADDTDEYILTLVGELESSLGKPSVDLKDAGNNSLLHMAAIWNRPKVMEALIRRGIELNDKNVSGHTALDLATHYGNVDLALQLRHYGAKHTCESERDLAVAQRDLAQQQLRDVDGDFQDALLRLKNAKQEREELRVERDRLVLENTGLVEERDALADEKSQLQQAVAVLTSENQQSLLQLAQLREALKCESDARLNAVQSWHTAQHVIAELQERELAYREREEEAIRMRNEALKDRDVAREIARSAQLDQGLAKQAQLDAERERDTALGRQLDAETLIETEKALWVKRIAKTERDRKNIQIEIDRQTAALRKECDRLEKQLNTASTLTWTLKEELADKVALVDRLGTKILYLTGQIQQLEQAKASLETQVDVLEEAQRSEHKAWRDCLEQSLRESVAHDLGRILVEVVETSDKLVTQQHALQALGLKTRRGLELKPEITTSLFLDSSLQRSPSSVTRKHVTLLPLLPDRPTSTGSSSSGSSSSTGLGLGHSMSSPVLPLAVPSSPVHLDVESSGQETDLPDGSLADDFHLDLAVDLTPLTTAASTARASMHQLTDRLEFGSVADLVQTLASVLRQYLDAVTDFVSGNFRHFRKQVLALERMVERKDELIARFNQHRRDKPKKQPARLRECIYQPQL